MSEKGVAQEAEAAPPPATPEELAAQVADLEASVQTLNALIASLSTRILRDVDELRGEVNRRASRTDLEPLGKELERVKGRIGDIVDEVGYGEALDIAKVPPSILEAAYQAILDDVVEELKKARGAHDAEQHILESLEQLRQKTSGSELFHYKPQRLHVGVARPLEKGLASARQVQMTFEELLRHLGEPIQYHAPKNFRALIKIKSQEYSVDKALTLAKAWDEAVPRLRSLEERVKGLEGQVGSALRDVQELARQLHAVRAEVALREPVEAPSPGPAVTEERLSESPPAFAAPVRNDAHLRERVLAEFGAEPRTVAALRKATGLDDDALRGVLTALIRDGLISSSMKGRSVVYQRKEEREHA